MRHRINVSLVNPEVIRKLKQVSKELNMSYSGAVKIALLKSMTQDDTSKKAALIDRETAMQTNYLLGADLLYDDDTKMIEAAVKKMVEHPEQDASYGNVFTEDDERTCRQIWQLTRFLKTSCTLSSAEPPGWPSC